MNFKLLASTVAALSVVGLAAAQGRPEMFEGKPMPAFKLKSIDGKVFTNKSLRGKVVLVDFWATWCGPCVASSPIMNKLYNKYKSQGLVVIGANITDGKARTADYKKRHKYAYEFAYDTEPLAKSLQMQAPPTFIFVDRKGVVQEVQTGVDLQVARQQQDFEGTIKRLLAMR